MWGMTGWVSDAPDGASPSGEVWIRPLGRWERLRPYGGVLKVQSEPGAGTHITLAVPLGHAVGPVPPMTTKILLADDHQIMREGLIAF